MYLSVKFVHVLTAIIALGTSAGLGIVWEFFGDDPAHGAYVLRAVRSLLSWLVLPGYALMLVTGLWLAGQGWGLATHWVQAALGLWIGGGLCFVAAHAVLGRQIALFRRLGPASAAFRRASLLGRGLGAAGGFAVVAMLYLMVFKPLLAFLP
jgi:uncharacterized membrane protein